MSRSSTETPSCLACGSPGIRASRLLRLRVARPPEFLLPRRLQFAQITPIHQYNRIRFRIVSFAPLSRRWRHKSTIFRFNTLASALAFQARAKDILMIVLGDHDGERGEFWVVTPADAARLTRAGYEMA